MRHTAGGSSYDVEHGLHVVFDYPNLKRLLAEAAPQALSHLKKSERGANVVTRAGRLATLRPLPLPSPLHLLGGAGVLPAHEALALARLFLAALMLRPERLSPRERRRLDEMSFGQFAKSLGISDSTRTSTLFRMGEHAMFNLAYDPSALAMLQALRLTQQNRTAQEVNYLDGPSGEVLVAPLARAFEQAGGRILRFHPVRRITRNGARVTGLHLEAPPGSPHGNEASHEGSYHLSYYNSTVTPQPEAGEPLTGDYYIAALPPKALRLALDDELLTTPFFASFDRLVAQPTMGYQIYYDRVVTPPDLQDMVIALPGPFATLIDRAHVWSAPDGPGSVLELVGEEELWSNESDQEVLETAERAIERVFPEARRERIVARWFHRTRHDDYFITTCGSDAERPTVATPLSNLFLAGDYTANSFGVVGMEGAVVSGIEAANFVLREIGHPTRQVTPMSEPGGLVPLLRSALQLSGLFRAVVGYREQMQ
jgi:uncharacterized protein with NAD-binding domain and iron-sulfur cluster